MILVTLGTHPIPMDRLVAALDEILARGTIDEEIIVTGAAYGRRPTRARGLEIVPYDELVGMAHAAKAMVTHGGPASIALALSAGHSPVVVPRDPALHEHVDDHQIRFAAWLAQRRNIVVVRDTKDLEGALREVLRRQAQTPLNPPVPCEAIERLRSVVSSGQ